MTSHDVVNRLRRITGEQSIGHLGTLDPMATGVLPLLMGRFTRLAQYFSAAQKSYTGSIRFGFATDTYDAEGEPAGPDQWPVVEQSLTLGRVQAAAARFHGEMQQMPPPFSAKKIDGKPAYKLAREGKPVQLKKARVQIDAFNMESLDGAEAAFVMEISAGGYVRSVAHETGTGSGLRRASEPLAAHASGRIYACRRAHAGRAGGAGRKSPRRWRICACTRGFAARDARGDRRRQALGRLAQRCAGQSAGVLCCVACEGVCRTTGLGRNRAHEWRERFSAGAGHGVAQSLPGLS